MTEFLVKVLVQLPDGSFAQLPCAKCKDGGTLQDFEVVTQPSEKEAWNWAEVILPDRVHVTKK